MNELHVKRRNGFPIWVEQNGLMTPIYRVHSGNGCVNYMSALIKMLTLG